MNGGDLDREKTHLNHVKQKALMKEKALFD